MIYDECVEIRQEDSQVLLLSIHLGCLGYQLNEKQTSPCPQCLM